MEAEACIWAQVGHLSQIQNQVEEVKTGGVVLDYFVLEVQAKVPARVQVSAIFSWEVHNRSLLVDGI